MLVGYLSVNPSELLAVQTRPPREVLDMNNGSILHITEDVLEAYAMGMLPDEGCAPLEEHLLICSDCQTRLDVADAFIRIFKIAASLLPTGDLGLGEDAPVSQVRAVAQVS